MAQHNTSLSIDNASTPLQRKSSQEHDSHDNHPGSGISNYRAGIIWSWFVVTIPMTALTVVLLVLVFHYRIRHGNTPFENLRLASAQDETSVVYVNLNSSLILFFTSWASSLAPMLSGFILTLASFPIASRLFNDIQAGRFNRLPTPYQLSLTLRFFDGGTFGGIWSWFLYLFSWKKREPQSPPLVTASSVALLATLLGLLVSLADTWLHLTTTTVSFTQVSPITNHTDYSFGLTPVCLEGNNSVAGQRVNAYGPLCSVSLAVTGSFLANATISLGVMNNASDMATVYTHTNHTSYAYLGIPESPSLLDRDFTAKTYGAATQCQLMSKKCSLQTAASSTKYNCTADFAGFLDNTDLQTGFFTDSSMTKNIKNNQISNYGVGNPYFYAIAGILSTSGGAMPNSTQFVQTLHGPYAYVLGCNTTIYDIEYDRVNNTITRFIPTVSNTSVSNIWQTSISQTIDWEPSIEQALGAAVFSGTGQEFSYKVALAFSKATTALGADGLNKRPALAVQERETSLVARVPMAPLFTLVAVNLLYILCGLVFGGLALMAARNTVPDIQARLSIAGLVADRFEDPGSRVETKCVEDMFEEFSSKGSRRVALESTDSNAVYRYTTWRNDSE